MALRLCTDCNDKLLKAKVTRPLAEQSHLDSTVSVDEGECEMCGTHGVRELNSDIKREGFSIQGSATLTPCEYVNGVDVGSDGCILCHFNYGRNRHFGAHPGHPYLNSPFVYCTAVASSKYDSDPVGEEKEEKKDREETSDIKKQIYMTLTRHISSSYIRADKVTNQLVELFESFYNAKIQDSKNPLYSGKDMQECWVEMSDIVAKWVKILPPTIVHGLFETIFISGITHQTIHSYSSPENLAEKIVELKEMVKSDERVRSSYMDLLKTMKDEFHSEIEELIKDDDEDGDEQE